MEDLEIMRQQLLTLKQRLDTQKIINKDLMRTVMHNKASWLNRLVNIEIISIPIIYCIVAGASYAEGISLWYANILLIMTVIDVVLDWYLVRISPDKFSRLSILELKKFLLKQKKLRLIQTIAMAPLAGIWLVAFLRAFISKLDIFPYTSAEIPAFIKPGLWIVIIAAVVASIIVVCVLFNKMQRINDALIKDIDEIEKDA